MERHGRDGLDEGGRREKEERKRGTRKVRGVKGEGIKMRGGDSAMVVGGIDAAVYMVLTDTLSWPCDVIDGVIT